MARPRVAVTCFILPQELLNEKGSSSAPKCEPALCLICILSVSAGRKGDPENLFLSDRSPGEANLGCQ